MVLRVLGGIQVQTEVANRRILHAAWVEARLVCQLVGSKRLLLRLGVHLVDLERVHVLEMLLWLKMLVVHLRLEWVEGDAWMSSMQTAVQCAFRGRHRKWCAQAHMERCV
jgi:hypothetical protein